MSLAEALASATRSESAAEGRYWGFLSGVVTDTKDPKNLGRVKARLLGMDFSARTTTDWLIPAWPGGFEGIPRVDEKLIVGFLDGDPNRGFYMWHPDTATKKRATDAAVLGTSLVKMFNNLVTQFNQLRLDHNTHVHATAATGPPVVPTVLTTATAAQQAKNAAGSTVSASTSAEIVLSGRAKVGK